MLKSFFEYVFENIDSKYVTIYFSKRLQNFLYDIEKSSTDPHIVRLVNSIRMVDGSNQMASDITLIDLTEKNDMLSFIQANRIRRKYSEPDTLPKIDNFDNFEEWLGYIAKDTSHKLWKEQRGEVSIGKFTRKIFKDNGYTLTDSIIEKFVNTFKANFDFERNLDQKMQLVSGEDIRKWYLEDNYQFRKGQLGSSCMRYEKCQGYLDIYVENPEVCNLLIMYSDLNKSKISGRALIWKVNDKLTIMDRIYTINDYDIQVFKKYAEEKGWETVDKIRSTVKIPLKKSNFSQYPYVDNFFILNYIEGYLTDEEERWPEEGFYKLQNTDGGYSADDGVWSEYHGTYLNREDAVWCEGSSDWVYESEAIYLEYLDRWATPNEDTVYSEYEGECFYSDDVVRSEVMNDYLRSDRSVPFIANWQEDEDYIPKDLESTLIEIEFGEDKIKTLPKCVVLDPTTGKYHFRDEMIDGKYIQNVIVDKLKDLEVDTNKIKDYLLQTDIEISENKFNNVLSLEPTYLPFRFRNDKVSKMILKYIIYAYPNKDNQREGMPILPQERGLNTSDRHRRFANMILNFDADFKVDLINSLSLEERGYYVKYINSLNNDSFLGLTRIVSYFINDVLKDPEIYKMWYKWKNT